MQLGDEVRRIALSLDREQAPYPVGRYNVDIPMEVGRFGELIAPRIHHLEPQK